MLDAFTKVVSQGVTRGQLVSNEQIDALLAVVKDRCEAYRCCEQDYK